MQPLGISKIPVRKSSLRAALLAPALLSGNLAVNQVARVEGRKFGMVCGADLAEAESLEKAARGVIRRINRRPQGRNARVTEEFDELGDRGCGLAPAPVIGAEKVSDLSRAAAARGLDAPNDGVSDQHREVEPRLILIRRRSRSDASDPCHEGFLCRQVRSADEAADDVVVQRLEELRSVGLDQGLDAHGLWIHDSRLSMWAWQSAVLGVAT